MSAFVVSTEHIDALIAAGLAPTRIQGSKLTWRHADEWHELNHSNADDVGTMLLSECVRSVEFRYSTPGREAIYGEGWESDTLFDLPGTYREESPAPGCAPIEVPEWLTPYKHRFGSKAYAPVEVLSLLACYEYQTCEHDEWRETEAFAFCVALRDRMICALPGYSEAPWSL